MRCIFLVLFFHCKILILFLLYSQYLIAFYVTLLTRKEKVSDSVKPLYEELKKIYDWNVDESGKNKPRIKGDQRMYHESNDKPCTTEPSKNQTDPSEVHDETSGKYRHRLTKTSTK